MRLYSKVQRRIIETNNNIADYTYRVQNKAVQHLEDWVVEGITFQQDAPLSNKNIILTIYLYHFREGRQRVQLSVEVNRAARAINLEFALSQKKKEEIPSFSSNSGDKFLINVTAVILNSFNTQKYNNQSRNLYTLIEKIGWQPENEMLEQARKEDQKTRSLFGILLTFIISIFFWLTLPLRQLFSDDY